MQNNPITVNLQVSVTGYVYGGQEHVANLVKDALIDEGWDEVKVSIDNDRTPIKPIERYRNDFRCASCGREVTRQDLFCSRCGKPLKWR